MASLNFKQIYQAFFPKLVAYACKNYGINEQEAEDIAQNVLMELHMDIAKVKKMDALESYLFSCVKNDCLDFKNKASQRYNQRIEDNEEFRDADKQCQNCAIEKEEMKKTLRKIVKALPFEYRQVITLRFIFGCTIKEIAELLGITVKAVDGLLKRAKDRMKNEINLKNQFDQNLKKLSYF